MKNKRLEALLEEVLKARSEAEEHTPEAENEDVISKPEVEIKAEGGEPTEKRVESHKLEKDDVHPGEQAAEEIKEVVTEAEHSEEEIKNSDMPYKEKFEMLLKEFGVEKISELSDEQKKEFFNKLDEIHVSKEESGEEVYSEEELMEAFEALGLDTRKYTFEYLAEELGFENLNEISDEYLQKAAKASLNKRRKESLKAAIKRYEFEKDFMGGAPVKDPFINDTLEKASEKAEKAGKRAGTANVLSRGILSADEYKEFLRKEKEPVQESYTREELEELFESLELDTHKYTFEYLAEELGFKPEGEVEEAPEMVAVQPEPDQGEYDEEGSMAKLQIHTIADASAELYNMLGDDDNLPEWVQSKITLAKEYIDTARDYMKSQSMEQAQQTELVPVEEPQPVHSQPEVEEESLQERYVLKRHVGRPSKKEKALEAKGSSEINGKGEVVYTKGGK